MLGPYARLILILTILRGLVAYGQGKPKGGYVTRRWILPKQAEEPFPQMDGVQLHSFIIASYGRMLDSWRQGWDFDMTCQPNYRGVHFVNDALPPYWLCRALLDKLTPIPPPHVASLPRDDDHGDEDGPDRLADVNLKEMLTVARHFVTTGEGLGVPVSMSQPPPVGFDPFSPFNL